MGVELSIVIPTYQEKGNILSLLERLRSALSGLDWEVIYVDDHSPDGTADLIVEEGLKDSRIRCLKRVGRRGLSSACIEGMSLARAPFVAVMDADLQHDERLLPRMLKVIKTEGLDVVIGSRYVNGGSTAGWSFDRIAASQAATRFAQMITGLKIEDPMSGFFLLRKEFFVRSAGHFNGKGFKILLDLLLSSPVPPRFKELPYTFRARQYGESKLNMGVIGEYFHLVFDNFFRRLNGSRKAARE